MLGVILEKNLYFNLRFTGLKYFNVYVCLGEKNKTFRKTIAHEFLLGVSIKF